MGRTMERIKAMKSYGKQVNNNGRQYFRMSVADHNVHRMLVMKDSTMYGISAAVLVVLCGGSDKLPVTNILHQVALSVVCILESRLPGYVNEYMDRFGSMWAYSAVSGYYSQFSWIFRLSVCRVASSGRENHICENAVSGVC